MEPAWAWSSCHSPGTVSGNLNARMTPVFVPEKSIRPDLDKATCVRIDSFAGTSRNICRNNMKQNGQFRHIENEATIKWKLTWKPQQQAYITRLLKSIPASWHHFGSYPMLRSMMSVGWIDLQKDKARFPLASAVLQIFFQSFQSFRIKKISFILFRMKSILLTVNR